MPSYRISIDLPEDERELYLIGDIQSAIAGRTFNFSFEDAFDLFGEIVNVEIVWEDGVVYLHVNLLGDAFDNFIGVYKGIPARWSLFDFTISGEPRRIKAEYLGVSAEFYDIPRKGEYRFSFRAEPKTEEE